MLSLALLSPTSVTTAFEKRALRRWKYFARAKSFLGISRAKIIEDVLEGKRFGKAVDLGCGYGQYAPLFKKHCEYLVGVDRDPIRLKLAWETGCYDELYLEDLRFYVPPKDVEAIFLIDVIEHLEKTEGFKLLQRISEVPYILIITPSKFCPFSADGHHSLWLQSEFESVGFKTATFATGIDQNLYGLGILAVKEKPKAEEKLELTNLKKVEVYIF